MEDHVLITESHFAFDTESQYVYEPFHEKKNIMQSAQANPGRHIPSQGDRVIE